MNGNHEREVWIDDVRVIACILVLSGHLMQSMTSSDIIPANEVYQWFNKTIYYFHVPLFFVCSGYLYQKHSKINNVGNWIRNILKKLLTLGVPYFTFTIITWLIKGLSSGAGNNKIDNIFETLFVYPTAPFWYLYTLFFCFLITVTFSRPDQAVLGIVIALTMKIVSLIGMGGGSTICNIFTFFERDMVCLRNEFMCV